MTKSEKVHILGIFSPKPIIMFRVGVKKLGYIGNRNHTYISFKPYENLLGIMMYEQFVYVAFNVKVFKLFYLQVAR